MSKPVIPEAERFQKLSDFPSKKQIVQKLELAIQSEQLALDDNQRMQCATSLWDLDRIALYLAEEHGTAPPDYRSRRTRVEHEAQRLRASNFEGSLMPLSYALGSFLAMLSARPHFAEKARTDSRLFLDLRDELVSYTHLDQGGQVKRDLNAILDLLHPSGAGQPATGQKPGRDKSFWDAFKTFWTTLPGILTAIAAVITAVTGLYVALKPTGPGGPSSISGAASAPLLVIEGVELFPPESNALAQVFANVNGTEFRYPSIAGVEWAEVGPAMSSQQFRLPGSDSGYQVQFRMVLRLDGVDRELVSQETQFVNEVPFKGTYRLYERTGRTRAASVRATLSFSVLSGT